MEEITAREMSRLGNAARMAKLSPERRKEIARRAAQARWKKKNGGNGGGPENGGVPGSSVPASDKGGATGIM
jgi:hypothetical protein